MNNAPKKILESNTLNDVCGKPNSPHTTGLLSKFGTNYRQHAKSACRKMADLFDRYDSRSPDAAHVWAKITDAMTELNLAFGAILEGRK